MPEASELPAAIHQTPSQSHSTSENSDTTNEPARPPPPSPSSSLTRRSEPASRPQAEEFPSSETIRVQPNTLETGESQNFYEPVSPLDAVREGYPALDFRFSPLKTKYLILSLVVWLGIIAGAITLSIIQETDPDRLHLRRSSNYYLAQYAPGFVGVVTTVWWRTITFSYNKLIPYVVMANPRRTGPIGQRREAALTFRLNDFEPDCFKPRGYIKLLRARQYTTFSVNLLSTLQFFVVPLKSSFVDVVQDSTGWHAVVIPVVGYIIAFAYFWYFLATLAIIFHLRGRVTGLKWNPCSLAAQVALLQSSNVPPACEGLEFYTPSALAARLHHWPERYGFLRLGYWRDSRQPEQLVHCIRFLPSDPTRVTSSSAARTKIRSKRPRTSHNVGERPLSDPGPLAHDVYSSKEAPTVLLMPDQVGDKDWKQPLANHRYANMIWTLSLDDRLLLLLWLLLVAAIVGLAVMISQGWTTQGQYAPNVVDNTALRIWIFSFLPSILFSFCVPVFEWSDAFHRMLQPIRGMDKAAPARENLLLDYNSKNPVSVIFTALTSGHYRVAWGTFLATGSSAASVLAGNMFIFDLDESTFQASPFPTIAVLVIACIYLFALPFARIDPKYAAGRGLWTIIDTLSLCYDSPILAGTEFTAQDKTDNDEVFLNSKIISAKEKYQFGYYKGVSGRRRMGINSTGDVPQASEGGLHNDHIDVSSVDRIKSRYGFFRFNLAWFRRPRVVTVNPVAVATDPQAPAAAGANDEEPNPDVNIMLAARGDN